MKQLKKYTKALLIVLMAMMINGLLSCQKEGDSESPMAEITTPEISQEYFRGTVIYLNGLFTDNEALDRCEVNMASAKSTYGWDDPWQPETEVIALEGTAHELNDHLLFNGTIPLDIMSAPYVINIRVFDKAGNMSNYSRQIVIK